MFKGRGPAARLGVGGRRSSIGESRAEVVPNDREAKERIRVGERTRSHGRLNSPLFPIEMKGVFRCVHASL